MLQGTFKGAASTRHYVIVPYVGRALTQPGLPFEPRIKTAIPFPFENPGDFAHRFKLSRPIHSLQDLVLQNEPTGCSTEDWSIGSMAFDCGLFGHV